MCIRDSHSGNRAIDQIFGIQEDLALEIANHFRIDLNRKEVADLFKRYTKDPEVYIKMLEVRSKNAYSNDRHKVEEELRRVLAKEPENVLALRSLADIYLIRGLTDMPMDSVRKIALPLYLKAEELDEEGALQGQFGFYKLWYEWDFEGAEKYGKRGLSINDEWSINLLIDLYQKLGELNKAVTLTEKMEEINPIHELIYSLRARNNTLLGNVSEAEKYAKILIKEGPEIRDGSVSYTHLTLPTKA